MKRIIAILIAAIGGIVVAQDQALTPILVDPVTLEIVKPNATALASANALARVTAYTGTVAKAASALQPNAVATTNVIISADSKTNTIIIIGGQVTAWTVTE